MSVAEEIRVGQLPPPLEGEQLPPGSDAPPPGAEPTAPIGDVWPPSAIDSLAMLLKAPFAIVSVRLGDYWMLNDDEASSLAHAVAGVIPYSEWIARAGGASPWLVLGGQLLAVVGPRVMRTRAELAAAAATGGTTVGQPGAAPDDDRSRAARARPAPSGGRDTGALAPDPAVADESGGSFARSAEGGIQRLFGARATPRA